MEIDSLQFIGPGWNRALPGMGLCWKRCFYGFLWPLSPTSTSLVKKKGSWYDTCRFFTDAPLWKLGQRHQPLQLWKTPNTTRYWVGAQLTTTVKRCVSENLWGEYLQSKSCFKFTKKHWYLKQPWWILNIHILSRKIKFLYCNVPLHPGIWLHVSILNAGSHPVTTLHNSP